MVRAQLCKKTGLKKGTWSPEEDQKLVEYIKKYGIWKWGEMPKYAGLKRSGKSCRLRWMNYLRPNIKHGNFTRDEEETILKMHEELGNKWSAIAAALPGRTDNEIKNYWHSHLKKLQHRPAAQPQECKTEANYQINLPKLDLISQDDSSQFPSGLCLCPINEDLKINGNLGSETLEELPTLAEQIVSLDNLHAQSLQDMMACMQDMIIDPDCMLLYYQFWCQDPLSPYGFCGEPTSDLSWFNL